MLPDWVFDDEDHRFMAEAFNEARAAGERNEVPIGAIVVQDNKVIARAGNTRQEMSDPTGHAEIVALRRAASANGDWRLEDCTLYVTLEPCPMCVSACRQARLDLVVWGASDPAVGACGTVIDLATDPRLGPALVHRGGCEADSCKELLTAFFAKRRRSS
ncbi:MAG: nucleoside deaminase [bacterium]|nr:nucleoside deaminase [bacterium]